MLLSNAIINYNDGTNKKVAISSRTAEERIEKYLFDDASLDYEKISSIDFPLNQSPISAGDDGFYLISGTSSVCRESSIGYFREREDLVHENKLQHLPIFGLCHGDICFISITTGMQYDSYAVIEVKDGNYNFYLRFLLDGEKPYEALTFELHMLEGKDKTYSGMGREYRKFQLANGFRTIRDKNDEELNFCAESLLVRIRHGWKPVPCSVFEQTPETEPPMHVACTFSQVIEIMRSYKAAGIDKADFSLVGWNIKGHDGRWPQILPVEESLGGEEGLKKLIDVAHELGYKVTCHTNSTDAYNIANNFDKNDLVVDRNGEYNWRDAYWAGGKAYQICPECAIRLAKETLPAVKELGFSGTHYIDVITSVMPHTCYSKLHPLTRRQSAEKWNELFAYAKELFGGISCENACDHTLKDCNFVLYVSFFNGELPSFVDESVPFWQIVYHGIVVSNPHATTVNAAASGKEKLLKAIEYGGRPVVYYYSKFVNDGKNWISDKDFIADTPEDIKRTTELAAQEYKIFEPLTYLQYEFIEEHEKISDGVYCTTYSDGTKVTVDYNNLTFDVTK
ncbi:MAG: hypothetical protein E7656_04920 [Ruminococcaceae bacterium]|nr:hypothetical protein [Oscillospiraceae bacterium]